MKKNIRNGVLISLILVIIIAGGISCFTWYIGKTFVGLVSADTSGTGADAGITKSSILSLKEVTLWICQVGVYQEKSHAESAQRSLNDQGFKAAIIFEEPYTVAVGAFISREDAVKNSSILKKDAVHNWVRETNYPGLRYKISGKEIKTAAFILETANTVLTKQREELDLTNLRKEIQSVSNEACPADFRKLKNGLETLLDTGLDTYNLQLLQVYTEYKMVTAKYFD